MLKLRWSLRQQILSPLLLITILFLFWLADRVTSSRQMGMDAIEDQVVLSMAKELANVTPEQLSDRFMALKPKYPGWEFAAFEGSRLFTSTIPLSERDQRVVCALPTRPPVLPGRDYRMTFESAMHSVKSWFWVTKTRVTGPLQELDIVLLYSSKYGESLDALVDRQDEMMAAGITAALVLSAVWYSGRLSRRITQIQGQVRRIADGQTSEAVDERGQDEISELARSVNHMAADLGMMKQRVEQAERSRLHIQLGRGIAHELRNGVHSARLALEMYREDEPEGARSPLLTTSYDQLCITELLVRRLLAVGQTENRTFTARPLRDVLHDAARLIDPMFRHAEVDFAVEIADNLGSVISHDSESMQSAIINLCLNALEAAGRHGNARLEVSTHRDGVVILVSDSGAGPAANVADSIFDPFVTTKPEGVGLGLVLVRQTVHEAGGTVDWHREGGRTVFSIRLPGGQ